jgi:hypothetical protein
LNFAAPGTTIFLRPAPTAVTGPDETSPMPRSLPLRLFALLCCAAACTVLGCSSSNNVKGKVVLPAGVQVDKQDSIQITLASADGKTSVGGAVDPSSLTFTIGNRETKIPAGKYKVAVSCQAYPNPDSKTRQRQLDDAFAPFAADKTPLTVDVTGAPGQQITVDLSSKTVQ